MNELVKMVASDQPGERNMTPQQATELLEFERIRGLSLWTVSADDPNYILKDGKIISRPSKGNPKDA